MKKICFSYTLIILVLLFMNAPELNAQNLATLKADAQLSSVPARALVTARNHHFIIDSPPPLGGSNEAINPIEILLSSLASCGVLVSEKVAQEMNIPLTAVTASAEGDLDPRGVRGEDVNPRIQVFRVHLSLTGPTNEQAKKLVEAIRTRCPIYATLERAAPIEMELEVKPL